MSDKKQLKEEQLEKIDGGFFGRVHAAYYCKDCKKSWRASTEPSKCPYCGSENLSKG